MREDPGTDLYYEECGAGRPIVLIHGLGANLCAWRKLKPLSESFRLIMVDLKGFGRSPKPEASDYSIFGHAADICRLIKRLGLKDAVLAGNSFGGGVSLVTALRLKEAAPEAIGGLILIGSVGYPQPLSIFFKVMKTPVLGPVALGVIPPRLLAHLFLRQAYFDPKKIEKSVVEDYARPLGFSGAKKAMSNTVRALDHDGIEDVTKRYNELDIPVLLIWGRHDVITPLWVGQRLQKDIPGADLKIIEGCGHVPQEESPEPTLRFIRDFLGNKNGV